MIFDQMVRGRDSTELSVGEFLKPLRDQGLIQTKKIGRTGIVEYMDEAHVKALDLVTGDLLRRLRDTGIMSRELEDILNVDAIGGPTQAMVEQLIAVTKLSKMSRLLWGQSGIGLKGKGGKMMTAKQLNAAVDAAARTGPAARC